MECTCASMGKIAKTSLSSKVQHGPVAQLVRGSLRLSHCLNEAKSSLAIVKVLGHGIMANAALVDRTSQRVVQLWCSGGDGSSSGSLMLTLVSSGTGQEFDA